MESIFSPICRVGIIHAGLLYGCTISARQVAVATKFCTVALDVKGRDSTVGIATRYGLGGPGIESRWARDFSHPSRAALGPTQPPIQWYRVAFLRVKRPRRGVNHPPHLAPRLKKVQRYTSTPPLGLRGLFQGELHLHLALDVYGSSVSIFFLVTLLVPIILRFHLDFQKNLQTCVLLKY